MKIRLPGPTTSAALLVALGAVAGIVATHKAPAKTGIPSCDGEYADSLLQLAPRARDIEQSPRADYTYLVRSSARYECPFYGTDRKLHQRTIDVSEHGTAFAYEVTAGETFLLTNEHVATWPEVTDAAHKVDGAQDGCKRVQQRLRIVHDERDSYEAGQVPLLLVIADAALDAAVVKASQPLAALPYRVGKSAALRQGNAVQVRGFPLGLIRAVNTGKVVNPYDVDQEQGWNHVDFVVDALLSEGNSGSPVLALSCKTGELQLVGMYHAGYKGHSALNVVVGIDQIRDFMVKKKRIVRAAPEGSPALSAASRKRLRDSLTAGALPVFEFGGLHVVTETAGESLVYHVFGRDFPLDDRRLAVLEDRPSAAGFGEIGRLWIRGESGLRLWPASDLGADEKDLLVRLGDAVRLQMLWVMGYRRSLAAQNVPDERRRGRELLRTIERQALPARELASSLIDLVERLGPPRDNAVATAAAPDAGVPSGPAIRLPRTFEP